MENELPTSGLVITPSSMATAIAEGRKTLLVKTKSYDIANREMLLLDRNKALAVVRIGEKQELSDDSFEGSEDKHLITKEIRKDWSEAQPSWGDGPFFQWPIEVVEKFEEPIETEVEMSPAVVINEVDIDLEKRGVVSYFGNLDRFAKHIMPLFPKHKTYVEPFCGRGEMIWHKEQAEKEILSDIDDDKVFCLRAARKLKSDDLKDFDWLMSKKTYSLLTKTSKEEAIKKGDAFRFYRWLYLLRGSRFGTDFGKTGNSLRATAIGATVDYARKLKNAERLKDVVIEKSDYKAVVKKYDSKDTLFFVDPSYPDKQGDYYQFDCPDVKEIADTFKNIKGKVVIVIQGTDKQLAELNDNFNQKKFKWNHPIANFSDHVSKYSIGRIYYNFDPSENKKIEDSCGDKPKKKSFDEVETNSLEFIDVTEDQHTFDGLNLTPEVEPACLSTNQLIEVHKQLHEMYANSVEWWSTTDIVNYHSLVADELYSRDKSHPAPPDNGLDDISFDFEAFGQKQTRWFETEKVEEIEQEDTEYLEKRRLALWGSTAGKSRVAKKIVAMIPEHKTYVEPFAGGAAVFYAKEPSEKEVLCDSNPEVVHAFKFVQSASDKEVEALGKMDWTVSKERAKAVHSMKLKSGSDRFFRFAYKRYAMFFCNDNRITAIDPSKEGKSPDIVGRIPETKERLKGVTILDGGYDKAIKKFDSFTTFFYFDPPYPSLVQEVGENSFDEAAFIKSLKGLKGKFLLHYEANAKKKFDGVDGWSVKTVAVTRTPGHTQGGGAPGKLLEVRNYELPKKIVKKNDLYSCIPDGERPFTVQHHWVGKSMSSILRIGVVPGRSAIGWKMNTQRVDVGEPVTTLMKSRELTERGNDLVKIDWSTGQWINKCNMDVPVEVLCKRQPISSYSWLDIEAKTMSPKSGQPAPLGGSSEYPGVFEIVEKGVAEFGAQTDSFHEYFLRGSKFSGRTTFRMMRIRKSVDGGCQVCGTDAKVDVGWADVSPVKLCEKCFGEWKDTEGVESLGLPQIADGVDVSFWFAMKPQDSIPYVLTEKAVVDEWMPPDGVSALPTKIKSQVPSEYAYWDEAGIDARDMRDALVKAIQDSQVTFDFEVIFKSDSARSRFVLQKQTWDDGDDPRWFVRIDTGKSDLNVIELHSDPMEVEKNEVRVWVERYKSSMDVDGVLSVAHYLNSRKGVRSSLSKIDSGGVSVLSDAEESTQVEFSGDVLKGVFTLKRSDNGYLLESEGEDTIAEIEKMVDFELTLPIDYFEINKAEKGKEKRLVTGIVLEPDMIDAQDDTIKSTVIEKAAHLFLTKYNKETKLGLMHTTFGDIGIELCQSFIAPVDYSVGKKKVKKGSWVMTVHVTDDNRWYDIKNRRLTGFSIGGKARMAKRT